MNSQIIFVLSDTKPFGAKEILDTFETQFVDRIVMDFENVAITQILTGHNFKGCG